MSAFAHGDEHDVRHAHDARDERQYAYHPERRTQQPVGGIHAERLRESVPYPYGVFVVGRGAVLSVYPRTIVGLERRVLSLRVEIAEREDDVARLVALAVYGAERRERYEGVVAHAALLTLVDAHDAEGECRCTYQLSVECERRLRQQFLRHVRGYDYRLAAVLKVELVDEASADHRALVDVDIVRVYAAQLYARGVVAAVDERLALLRQFCAHGLHVVVEALLGDAHVLVVQLHGAPFAQSVVRLRRLAAVHHH